MLRQSYKELIYRLFRFDRDEVFDFNLESTWYGEILRNNVGGLSVMTVTEVFSSARVVAVPYVLALVFERGEIIWLGYLWLGVILTDIIFQLGYGVGVKTVMRIKRSFLDSMESRILKVDPVYNSMRSTGALTSQLTSGVAAIENLVYGAFYHGVSLCGLLLSSVFVLYQLNPLVALLGVVFLLVYVCISSFGYYVNTQALKHEYVQARKSYIAGLTEHIIQTPFIRSIFGTSDALDNSKNLNYTYSLTNYRVQRGVQIIRMIGFAIQGAGLCIFSWYVWRSDVAPAVGLSLIFAMYQVSSRLRIIGKVISGSMEQLVEVQQTYETITEYGSQSYPVTD